MTQPAYKALHNVRIHDLAETWARLVVDQGHVDPAIELNAVPVLTTGHAVGWRPAIRIPATRTLIVVHAAAPHAIAAEAIRSLGTLLGAMALAGSITLHGRAAA